MKLFLSWSKDYSKEVAEAFHSWIKCVLQYVDPYHSVEDSTKGSRWATEISRELSESNFGILFITKSNYNNPWINFEAGSLSKKLDKSKVCPILIDLKLSDIDRDSPLLHFQAANINKEEMFSLVKSINNECDKNEIKLDDLLLQKIFDTWWPEFEKKVLEIKQSTSSSVSTDKYPQDDRQLKLLEELLIISRENRIIIRDEMAYLIEKSMMKYLDKISYTQAKINRQKHSSNNMFDINDIYVALDVLANYKAKVNKPLAPESEKSLILDILTHVSRPKPIVNELNSGNKIIESNFEKLKDKNGDGDPFSKE